MLFLGSPHQRLTPAEALGLVYFHPILGSLWGKSLLWIPSLDSLRISKSTLQSEVLPVQSYLCSSSFSQGRMHIMLWSFPFSISPPFSFILWKHCQAKSLTWSICISVPASQRTQLTQSLLTLFLCGQSSLVRFLRVHTLQHFSCMYIWMYVFWMSIHQHISVYFLLKFHVFISMHTYSKITLFHTGSHSGVFSAYLYQCTNAHYLRGK